MDKVMSDKEAIIANIERFFESLDKKDWHMLKGCLTETIYTDYSCFRKTPPETSLAKKYITQRRHALNHLITAHKGKGFKISVEGDTAHCTCDFEIQRFTEDHAKHFHTSGSYRFELVNKNTQWLIHSIEQLSCESHGDESIHGAFNEQ